MADTKSGPDWLFKSEQIIAAFLSLLLNRGVRKTEICAQDVTDAKLAVARRALEGYFTYREI
jgi:hypothetical protein